MSHYLFILVLMGENTLYIDVKYKWMNRPVNELKNKMTSFVDDRIGFEVNPYFISYCYGVMFVDLYEVCILRYSHVLWGLGAIILWSIVDINDSLFNIFILTI